MSLTDSFIRHFEIQRIQIFLQSLTSVSTQVTFRRIPGHTDTEKLDAIDLAPITSKSRFLLSSSCLIRKHITPTYQHVLELWSSQCSNELHLAKKDTKPWSSSNREFCCKKIVLARLRFGHTHLTHSHLFNSFFFPHLSQALYNILQSITLSFQYLHESISPRLITFPTIKPPHSIRLPFVTLITKNDKTFISDNIIYEPSYYKL